MTLSGTVDTIVYEKKCSELLQQPDIRFVAVINDKGQKITGGFKEGIVPLEKDEARIKAFFELASRETIQKEFDDTLGPINYLAARRDKVVLISFPFPISNALLLISAEPTVDIERLAKRVTDMF